MTKDSKVKTSTNASKKDKSTSKSKKRDNSDPTTAKILAY